MSYPITSVDLEDVDLDQEPDIDALEEAFEDAEEVAEEMYHMSQMGFSAN